MATKKEMVDRAVKMMRKAGEDDYDWQATMVALGDAFDLDGDEEEKLMEVIGAAEARLGWNK